MSIVILGGNFAGLKAAALVFDEIAKTSTKSDYNVTVVSPSDKWYFNPASPRLLVDQQLIEKAFLDVEQAIEKRSKGASFTFVKGKAVDADFTAGLVKIELSAGGEDVIDYDYLIVATGARAASPAFKLNGNHEDSIKELEDIKSRVEKSESIAVLGGGVTGVEVIGELAFKYPKKKFTLFTGSNEPLSNLGGSIGAKATSQLVDLGVEIVNNKRYTDIDEAANGSVKITFDDGSLEIVGTYIPTVGITANSEFIEDKYLDENKYLKTGTDLVVEGTTNVFAFGDIVSGSKQTLVDIKLGQQKALDLSIRSIIFKSGGSKGDYQGSPNIIAVPISKNGGVGYMFGWSAPSFLIKFLKGKDYMLSKASSEV